jgi:hypothetical protein
LKVVGWDEIASVGSFEGSLSHLRFTLRHVAEETQLVHAVHPIPPHWLYNGSGQGIVDKVVDEDDVIETVVVTIFVIVLVEVVVEVEVLDEVLVEAGTVTYTVLVDVEVGVGVTVMVITAIQDRKVSYLPSFFTRAAERRQRRRHQRK